MRRLILIITLLLTQHAHLQTVDTNFVDGRIYLRMQEGSTLDLVNYDFSNSFVNQLFATYGIQDVFVPFPSLNDTLNRTLEVVFTSINDVNTLITGFETLPDVEFGEKKPLARINFIPNDLHPGQWGLLKVMATEAWDITTGSNSVKIAIVDNAVMSNHEDLLDNIWTNPNEIPNNGIDDDLNGYIDDVNGFDVADLDNNPAPPVSADQTSLFTHGTHCAGIASASTNNGIGMAGLGYNCSVIPVKCTKDSDPSGGGLLTNAYDGVYYAIQAGADVISMSFGGSGGSAAIQNLMNAASTLGITLVAAAGNNNSNTPSYPAAYQRVISVGSTDQTDLKSSFSNYGSTVDVMAPGSGIYSTLSGGNFYGYKSGTSMACPLVAGLCGLIKSMNPSLEGAQVEQILKNGCDPIDALNPGYENQLGAGRINAYNSLQQFAGLNENNEITWSVYPNPNSGNFTVTQLSAKSTIEVKVFDSNGRLVMSTEGADDIHITLNQPGVYVVHCSNEFSNKQFKVVCN